MGLAKAGLVLLSPTGYIRHCITRFHSDMMLENKSKNRPGSCSWQLKLTPEPVVMWEALKLCSSGESQQALMLGDTAGPGPLCHIQKTKSLDGHLSM